MLHKIIHIRYNSGKNQNKQNTTVMKQNTIKTHRTHTQTIVMFSCKDKIKRFANTSNYDTHTDHKTTQV